MTNPAPAHRRGTGVGLWALMSAVLLAIACAIYNAHSDAHVRAVIGYTALFAAPYVFVAARTLVQLNPSDFIFEFAATLALVVFITTLIFALVSALGVLLLLMSIAMPLAVFGIAGAQIAENLQGAGLMVVLALVAAQLPLRYSARQQLSQRDQPIVAARFAGYATLLIPVVVFFHLGSADRDKERSQIRHAETEHATLAKARHDSVKAREPVALSIARTAVHVCVQNGCIDSLKRATAAAHLAFEFTPRGKNGYLALVAADRDSAPIYVTDETGLLARKLRRGTFGISWADKLTLVDSVYQDLELIRSCRLGEVSSKWVEYALNLAPNTRCGTQGDASIVHFGNGADYRVVYTSRGQRNGRRANAFMISAQPVQYGKPYVRSFLLTQDSAYVTTANRGATESDWSVSSCEADRLDLTCGDRRQ